MENCSKFYEERLKLASELLERMCEEVRTPPPKNCSCHISPPCTDCIENASLRELLEEVGDFIRQEDTRNCTISSPEKGDA